jgi:hypothetical protein
MKTSLHTPILDPLWLANSKYVDLEYYTYIMLGAKQNYLAELKSGSFSRFHEILFQYLNLNTAIVDKGIYDAAYNFRKEDLHIMEIIASLTRSREEFGGEILRMASAELAEVLAEYLDVMLDKMAYTRLYFNSAKFHKLDKIYVATTQSKAKLNHIWQINKDLTVPFLVNHEHQLEINEFSCEDGEFSDLVNQIKPEIKDFSGKNNVLVISSVKKIKDEKLFELALATIIANRLLNHSGGFNSNILLDIKSMLERGLVIPYKLKSAA